MKAIGKRVIVRELKEERTSSGIYLDEESMKRHNKDAKRGTVLSSGIDGVVAGDTVVFSRFKGTPFTYKGSEYLILDEVDLEAVEE